MLLYLILVVCGWVCIYAASYDYQHSNILDLSTRSGMQLVWIGSSFILGFLILLVDDDWYKVFSYWLYAFVILVLILTIFIAPEIKGSRSWLVIGPVSIQPAEFSKFATSLALARLLSGYKFKLLTFKNLSLAAGLFLLPILLIILQKETGSALVYLAFFIVLYREGMTGSVLLFGFSTVLIFIISIKYAESFFYATPLGEIMVLSLVIIIGLSLIAYYSKGFKSIKYLLIVILGIFVPSILASFFFPFDITYVALLVLGLICVYSIYLAIKSSPKTYSLIVVLIIFLVSFLYSVDYVFDHILEPHQKRRIEVSLGMIDDLNGAGYNVNQSKIAIGSGGFWGKGFLNGTQTKLKYVPEQDTDFIFCTVGEERGFVGTSLILIVFLVFLLRLIFLAERQKHTFNRVYAYSLISVLFFHVVINIGMVIGLTPVIGIPLPFFSYGGSSLWGFTILLFIFLRLDAGRTRR